MKDLKDLIPEIQYDVLARVVPGVLVIGACGWEQDKLFNGFGSAVLWVVASYALGYLIEMLAFPLLDRLTLKQVCKRLHPIWPKIIPMEVDEIWDFQKSSECLIKERLLKILAERSMLRSLLLVSIVALFYPPQVIKSHDWVAYVALGLVANSYYWIWQVASEQVVQSRNAQSSSSSMNDDNSQSDDKIA